MRRALMMVVVVAAAAALLLGLGPASWRNLAAGFLFPWTPPEVVVTARRLTVSPGNITLPRGASLDISIEVQGFEPGDALRAELQEFAKRNMAAYKYPRQIEFVEALPKTPSGKVKRRELRGR